MTISIDFDGTWTRDPHFWRNFVTDAIKAGHDVIMVTGRKNHSEDMDRANVPNWLPVIYAGDSLKSEAVRKAGKTIDVWIDDTPGTIQPQLVIGDQSL